VSSILAGVEVAEAESEVEAEAAEMETVGNDSKQVMTAVNRWQQW
jgi:hypothetical protein